jgi:hypothetical protein
MAGRQAMQEAKPNLVSTVPVYRTHLRFLIAKQRFLPAQIMLSNLLLACLFWTTILTNGGSPIRSVLLSSQTYSQMIGIRTTNLSDGAGYQVFIPGYLVVAGLLLTTAFAMRPRRIIIKVSAITMFFGILVAISTLTSFNQLSTLNDAWAIGFTIPCAMVFAVKLISSNIKGAFQISTVQLLVILCIVVGILRLPSGLFDRGAPFYVCGPIVWGWLMAVGILCLVDVRSGLPKLQQLLYFSVLGSGLLMSDSRGPVLCLIFSYVCTSPFRLSKYTQILVLAAVLTILISTSDFESRLIYTLSDLNTVLSNVRFEYLGLVIPDNPESWILGNGARHFGFVEPTGLLQYPHNVFLEALDYYGVIAMLVLMFVVVKAMWVATRFFKSMIIFFSLALCLSGDLSYLRYLLPWCLLVLMGARKSRQWLASGLPLESRTKKGVLSQSLAKLNIQ